MLKQLDSGTTLHSHVASGMLHSRSIVGGSRECEYRSAEHERGERALKTVHASPFEPQIYGDLDCVEPYVLVLYTVGCPYLMLSEVDVCTMEVVVKTEIDAESDARDHYLAHDTRLPTA